MTSLHRASLLFLVVLSGCAHTFPAQYDLDALHADSAKWPGEALVHYLSRPGADASACVSGTFARLDDALVDPFVASLDSERVPGALWAACAQRLLPTLPAPLRGRFLDRLAPLVLVFVERPNFARLQVAHEVLASRPREPSAALQALRPKLRPRGPEAVKLNALVAALRLTLELEDGTLEGEVLTEARVLRLDDEVLLRRIDARAPDGGVRKAARRRVVQLHIAASPLREVKARAAEVEARVLASGRWAQPVASLAAPAPQPALLLPVDVRGSQDIAAQLVRLFLAEEEGRRPPGIDLHPWLRFHVGWSEPLPLCAAPEALEVMPCVDPAEVKLGTGFATLDGAGVLRLPGKLAMADAIDLTRAGVGLVVPVQLGERVAQVLQVPLTMQTPASFCFEGQPSDRGPAVNVVVVPSTQGLLVEAVDDKARRRQFVLPRSAVGVEFGSCGGRGVIGSAGSPGMNGSRGSNGMSGSCPSTPGGSGGPGGNGSPGGPGGNGGPGGEGGLLRVELVCGSACEDEPLVRAAFRSRGGLGGEGGPGGTGGRGGDGGSGGTGTSCYQNGKSTYASGGSSGSRGSDGAQGPQGRRGAPGRDGPVEFLRR